MWVWSLGWEDTWRRKWLPTLIFLPGKLHGQKSLVDYSPWGLSVRHDLVIKTRYSLYSQIVRLLICLPHLPPSPEITSVSPYWLSVEAYESFSLYWHTYKWEYVNMPVKICAVFYCISGLIWFILHCILSFLTIYFRGHFMSIYTVTLLMGTKYSPEWAYNSLFNQSCLNGHLRRFFSRICFFVTILNSAAVYSYFCVLVQVVL